MTAPRFWRGTVLVALLGLCAPTRAPAQATTNDTADRPKIGVALGGGGARGLAHVGALRVLEELHIPVDYIAGTSIGAVIGGLYASGVELDEIEARIRAVPWAEVIRGRPPRTDVNYRRKQDDRLFPVQMELGLGGRRRVKLPAGLLSGQRLEVLLGGLTLPVATVRDFDALPIPFRSVATDVETGELVELASGDLVQAIRASLAIPGVFAPVDIDGRLLVDGGIARTVPIDVVQRMGADIVIAVDVSTPLGDRDELDDFVGLTAQVLRLPSRTETAKQVADLTVGRDVVVRPDLDGLSAAAFDEFERLMAAGRAAANQQRETLATHSVAPSVYRDLQARRRALPRVMLTVDYIRLDNASRFSTRALEEMLRLQPGGPLDFQVLRADLSRVYGLGWFESVSFSLERTLRGQGVVIRVVPKPWGPHYLRFGLGLQDNLEGSPSFEILASLTLSQLNGRGGELRNEIQIGGPRRISTEFYQPVAAGMFVSVSGQAERAIHDVYIDGRRIAQYRDLRASVGADVGWSLGRWGELRGGLFTGRVSTRPRVGATDSLDVGEGSGGWRASLGVDRLDDRSFPLRGTAINAAALRTSGALGAERAYSRVQALALQALPVGTGALILSAEGGSALNTELPFYDEFGLGGLRRISGIRPREETGRAFYLVRALYYRSVGRLPTAVPSGRLFLGISAETGTAWREERRPARVGATVFLGLETLLGPLNLAYGRADQGEDAWYLSLGLTF